MRRIKKVGVLGSGIMGSGIACHLANAGFNVLLLDIPAQDGTFKSKNDIVNQSLAKAINSNPEPLYSKSLISKINTGNFDDNMEQLQDCDWVIEVVKEDLTVKKAVYTELEKYRKPGTLVTSNTSGIPIRYLVEGRSEDFSKNFCGTHFFNPPRYLALLEIIPGPNTNPGVINFFMSFGREILGKTTVLAKDTPAFVANRIGVYSMSRIYELAQKLGVTIQAVDKLTGAAIGRPNTGTFRLGDLVGLDTAYFVTKGIKDNNPHDIQAAQLEIPDFFQFLYEQKFFGNKSGQGFYKKTDQKDEKGKPIIYGLDLNAKTYIPDTRQKLASLDLAKQIEDPKARIKALVDVNDVGGQLLSISFGYTFSYAATRIPEIADQIFAIDDAMRAGFAWDYGPFEYWDIIGFERGVKMIHDNGDQLPQWVEDMSANGLKSFYLVENGVKKYYDHTTRSYKVVPGSEHIITLNYLKGNHLVAKNDETNLYDLGDGVLNLEFTSKMNAIGGGILYGLNEAIDRAEQDGWDGLVIANNSKNFTVGANLMMIAMLAYEQEFEELNQAVHLFQQTSMKCRYSRVPVVAATQGYVFGGGCELSMHCDAVAAAAESYIGLVEVGVGLIPGGGGTKEFAVRTGDAFYEGDVMIPRLVENFKTIATASVATSALSAFEKNYLNQKDFVVMYQPDNIYAAKQKVLELAEGYVPKSERKDIYVLGQSGLGALYAAAHSLKLGHYASDHDINIAHKIAWVMCGGDLSAPQKVSEQYLLDLEREAFLSLCGESKTLERIQHMLETGKPLRN